MQAFERILQAQGAYGGRLAVLDQAAYRVRATNAVTARAYRVYDAILDVSRGNHRCCLLDLDKIAHLAGVHDRSVASKVIAELEEGSHVATLKFTEGPLGKPTARRLFVAPIVTAEDRVQTTSERIYAEADAAKTAALQKRAEDARKRRGDASEGADADAPDPRSGRHVNYADVVDATSTTDGRVVDRLHIRSGRHGNSVNKRSNTKEREEAPADAGSPPSQFDHDPKATPLSSEDTLSAASSPPPVHPNGSGAGVPDPRRSPAPVAQPAKANAASDRRGTRLPPDWALPDGWRDWALSEFNVSAAQVQREADKFRDHWHGVPPAQPNSWKSDWFATWRNWCRREKTFTPRARPVARPSGQAAFLPLNRCRRLLDLYPVKHISDWRLDVHGPPPNQPGCRFSPDTIRELGISHLTGAST